MISEKGNTGNLQLSPYTQLGFLLEPQVRLWSLYQLAWTAMTRYHTLGGLNNRHLCSHSSGGWKVPDQGASMVGLWRGPSSLLADATFLLCPQCQRAKSKLLMSPCKGTNPIRAPSPHPMISSNPNYFLKVHLQIPSYWGVGLQHTNFMGMQISLQQTSLESAQRQKALGDTQSDSSIISSSCSLSGTEEIDQQKQRPPSRSAQLSGCPLKMM